MSTNQNANIQAFRDYAKQGILAVSAINSGALVASLANVGDFTASVEMACAFRFWVAGLAAATMCWLFAYLANASYSHGRRCWDGLWTFLGLASFVTGIVLFGCGGWFAADSFMVSK